MCQRKVGRLETGMLGHCSCTDGTGYAIKSMPLLLIEKVCASTKKNHNGGHHSPLPEAEIYLTAVAT